MGTIKSIGKQFNSTGARFNSTLAIKQVGARPIRVKGRQMFALGGGVFTRREIAQSRLRFAKSKGIVAKRASVGL